MLPITTVALFVGSVAAQSSVTVFNILQMQKTITMKGADATATTYENICPSSSAGVTALTSATTAVAPLITTAARLRRQQSISSSDDDTASFCEPYTLKQGASTWELHLTDPQPGAWTVDMACKWKGQMTVADMTCTITQSGSIPAPSLVGTSTSILKQSDVRSLGAFQTADVVTATGVVKASPSKAHAATHSPSSGPMLYAVGVVSMLAVIFV